MLKLIHSNPPLPSANAHFNAIMPPRSNEGDLNEPSSSSHPSSSSSTPTTTNHPVPPVGRPTSTRLPSMRDLLSEISAKPTITSPHTTTSSSQSRPFSRHHSRLNSSERSTLHSKAGSPDDTGSSMALDEYAEKDSEVMADRRKPSGAAKEAVENWTRSQRRRSNNTFDDDSSYAAYQEASPRRTSGGLVLGDGELSRDPGEVGEAYEWTSVAPPRRGNSGSEVSGNQPQHRSAGSVLNSPRHFVESHPDSFSPPTQSSQLASFGAPLASQHQSQNQPNILHQVPTGFSGSRERASTMSLPRADLAQEYVPAPRFSPTYPPGHPSSQAHVAAHLRQAPGSRDSILSGATGRSSLASSGGSQGPQWDVSRSRSDSSASMSTNNSSVSAISPNVRMGHLQKEDPFQKEGFYSRHQQSNYKTNSSLLFAPLSPVDGHYTGPTFQVPGRSHPAVLASGAGSRQLENGTLVSPGSSASYPPSPVSPLFMDDPRNPSWSGSTVARGSGGQPPARRSWDAESLRGLVSPAGPPPHLPNLSIEARNAYSVDSPAVARGLISPMDSLPTHGWAARSPITQVSGLPSHPSGPFAYSANYQSIPGSAQSTPPVPTLSLPPAPDRLANSRRRRRPPASYASLITQAISSSATQLMSLREIYAWIHAAHPSHYALDGANAQGWQNTVRHNLSLNKAFVKAGKGPADESGSTKGGKGGLWTLDRDVIRQRAVTGQGAGAADLAAALVLGEAMRDGKGDLLARTGAGSSSENDDGMSVDEGTPSPRLALHPLPFPGSSGHGSAPTSANGHGFSGSYGSSSDRQRAVVERSSTTTLRGSQQGAINSGRRRSRSHFEPSPVSSHQNSNDREAPSVLRAPSTPSFTPSGVLPPQQSSYNRATPSLVRPLAGRTRGYTISNGEIAAGRPQHLAHPSPSKRKLDFENSVGMDLDDASETRSRQRFRSQGGNSPTLSKSHLTSQPVQQSSSHLKVRNFNSNSRANEDEEEDDRRPSKSPKLTADLQLLAVNDKDEESGISNGDKSGQSMSIRGLLC